MARVLPILVLMIFAALIFFASPIFKIKNTQIIQNQVCFEQETLNEIVFGRHIFFLNEEKLKNEMKNKISCLEDIVIMKLYPSTLKVEVIVKQPVVQIAQTDLFLTEKGEVIKGSEFKNKPLIYLPSGTRPQPQETLKDNTVIFALKLAQLLSKSDYNAVNIRFIDVFDIAVYNQEGVVSLFSSKKPPDAQVGSLQATLTQAKIDGTKIAKIDLRFNKPVMVFNKQTSDNDF